MWPRVFAPFLLSIVPAATLSIQRDDHALALKECVAATTSQASGDDQATLETYENVALASNGSVAFGSGSLGGYCYTSAPGDGPQAGSGRSIHCYWNINDGRTGDSYSWIPGGSGYQGKHFVGVRFPALSTIHGFRVSRGHQDRFTGSNTIEYSTSSGATYTTTDWCSAGTFTRSSGGFHFYKFSQPIEATALRIRPSRTDSCFDELVVFGKAGKVLTGHGHGDPHLKNMQGEDFDVMQEGNMLLVETPRHSTSSTLDFALRADINRLGAALCGPTYITQIGMEGRWVGDSISIKAGKLLKTSQDQDTHGKHAFAIRLFDTWRSHVSVADEFMGSLQLASGVLLQTQPRTFVLKIKGLHIVVSQPKRPRVFLDLQVTGLETLSGEVGGLLGIDDHSEAQSLPAECQ